MKNQVIFLFALLMAVTVINTKAGAQTCGSYTYTNVIDNTSILATPFVGAGTYAINADVDITVNTVIEDAEILIAPGIKITVYAGATLTINGSHLFGCTEMWTGIEILREGRIIVKESSVNDNTLIEDADIAIRFPSTSYKFDDPGLFGLNAFEVTNTIFNRNRVGISVEYVSNTSSVISYPSNYPVILNNSIFTCRDIPFSPGSGTWVNFETFKNTTLTSGTAYPNVPGTEKAPYIDDATYSPTNAKAYLKLPFTASTKKSEIGIYLNSYYDANGIYIIGNELNSSTSNNVTLFDNQSYGAKIIFSDIRFKNCTFQNTPGANPDTETYGVYAENYEETDFLLDMRVSPGTAPNAFFDCKHAITSHFYTRVNIEGVYIRSGKTAPLGLIEEGYEGVSVLTSSFAWVFYGNYITINKNELVNIAYPITLKFDDVPWFYNTPYTSSYPSELSNAVEINNNFIGTYIPYISATISALPGYFIEQAINVEVATPYAPSSTTVTYPFLRMNNNLIVGTHNGIRVSKFEGKNLRILNNAIEVNSLINNGSNVASGIVLEGSFAQTPFYNVVYKNFISASARWFPGYNPTSNAITNMLVDNGSDYTMRCNTSIWAAKSYYQFNGTIPLSFVLNNRQAVDIQRGGNFGFVLNNGIIGTQGSSTDACDHDYGPNTDYGIPPTASYKTMCINADATQSTQFIQTTPDIWNPDALSWGGGIIFTPYAIANSSLQAATTINNGCPIVNSRQLYGEDGEVLPIQELHDDEEISEDEVNAILVTDAGLIATKLEEAEALSLGRTSMTGSEPQLRLYVAQMQLYNQLIGRDSMVNANSVLRQFVAGHNNTGFGTIIKIGRSIMQNDSALAYQQLAAWQTTNRVDENYARYFKWTLNRRYKKPVNITEVEALALGCPQTDGNVVFAARNLYNAITNKHRLFTGNCSTGVSRQQPGYGKIASKIINSEAVTIYPNPASTVINIKGSNIKKAELLNVYGAVVYSSNVKANFITIPLTSFAKGVYIVKITTAANKVTTKKIIKGL